jgi:DNA-binding Lrp family transcriptional regulator
MGRGIAAKPLDVQVVQQHFACRQDGSLVRRQCHIDALSGEPATFIGPNGKRMARISVQGKVRRIAAPRIAWALHYREWPTGPVLPKNGDASDLRADNLVQTRHGAHQPQANGGRASSLERRQAANATLLNALATQAEPSLARLSEIIGLSEGRVSTRLSRLERQGLCEGPHCVPGRSWMLTEAGRAAVAIPNSVVIDDLNKRLLAALVHAPMRQLVLSRRVGVCSLTVRRRAELLIGRGLVRRDAAKRFSITDEGRKALGDAVPPRWVRLEAVSAALAKDVAERLKHPHADQTAAQRSAQASKAHAKALAYRTNKSQLFNEWSERLTG